jgi:hypothetical protein
MGMRVAIVGAGWTGCHLAHRLRDEHDLWLVDKEAQPFCGTSMVNQNRLHLGYHYARNHATRELCLSTFDQFMQDYGHLTYAVKDNWYAVPESESLLDAETIKIIFPPLLWHHEEIKPECLRDTAMVWRTQERYISPLKAQQFFSEQLSPFFSQQHIQQADLAALKTDFDLVVDCSNNSLLKPSSNEYFEAVAMFLYEQRKPLPFGALTYIDGPLFSFYPFHDGAISLSHVVHSVVVEASAPLSLHVDTDLLEERRLRAEHHAKAYWPAFDEFLEHKTTVVSMKSKRTNASAYRAPLFKQSDNLLSCYTGKIQGIYLIEAKVREALKGL